MVQKYRLPLAAGCALLSAVPYLVPTMAWLSWFVFIPFLTLVFTLLKEDTAGELNGVFIVFFILFCGACQIFLLQIEHASFTSLRSAGPVLLWGGLWLLVLLLCAVCYLPFVLCIRWIRCYPQWMWPVAAGAGWAIANWVSSWFCGGVTLLSPAALQAPFPVLVQTVSLFGTSFLDFILIFVSGLVALFVKGLHRRVVLWRPLAVAAGTFCTLALYGWVVVYQTPPAKGKPIQVSALHLDADKRSYAIVAPSQDPMAMQIKAALEGGSHLVLCPEAALPAFADVTLTIGPYLGALATSHNAMVVVGCITSRQGRNCNSLVSFASGQNTFYDKRKLVPVGEILPFEETLISLFPSLRNRDFIYFPAKKDQVPLLAAQDIVLGPMICYEALFSYMARESVLAGANLLVVSSAERWNNADNLKLLLGYQAVLRAVENGRYLVRSTHGGVSLIVSPTGQVLAHTKADITTMITARAALITEKTMYTQVGDLFVYACMGAALWGGMAQQFKKSKELQKTTSPS